MALARLRVRSQAARAAVVALAICSCWAGRAPAQTGELRVCADPNNLPFSDARETGFENRLAAMVATELREPVSYTWWAQRRGFIRNTLNAGHCDVIIGVPAHYDPVELTRPYYRSSYVFVSRADRHLDISLLTDPRLRHLRIGVHLVGADGSNPPPVQALGEEGIVTNVVGYSIYGDYHQDAPPTRLIEAVENGDIDVALAWGPLAGFAAKSSPVPLRLAIVQNGTEFTPLQFQFDIAMGVRKGDHALRQQLDAVILNKQSAIRSLLEQYGVPLVPFQSQSPVE